MFCSQISKLLIFDPWKLLFLKINPVYKSPFLISGENVLTYCLLIFVRCLWFTGTYISFPLNMGDQIGGVVWCSSGIIIVFCCDCVLCIGQVKCVPFALVLANLEHHHKELQLKPLEVCHHRIIGVGSGVYDVATCTSYTHYNGIYLYC